MGERLGLRGSPREELAERARGAEQSEEEEEVEKEERVQERVGRELGEKGWEKRGWSRTAILPAAKLREINTKVPSQPTPPPGGTCLYINRIKNRMTTWNRLNSQTNNNEARLFTTSETGCTARCTPIERKKGEREMWRYTFNRLPKLTLVTRVKH
jgi:hypothetical protein